MKAYKVFLAFILSLSTVLGMFTVSYASYGSMEITDALGVIVSGSVSASSTIYVKGEVAPGEFVMLSILKPMTEDGILSDDTLGEFLYWADDTIAGDDGGYSFHVDFSGCSTGDYIIRVASSDTGFFDSRIQSVINEDDRDATILAINSAADISEIRTLFEEKDAAKNLSLDINAYKRLTTSAGDAVYKAIFDYKNSQTLTVDKLKNFNSDVFLTASVLALYNQENNSNIVDEFSTIFGLLNNENTKKTYDLIESDIQRQATLDSICKFDYKTIEDMQKAYAVSVCLYAVGFAPWQSFDGIVNSNSYLFENMSMEKYNKLNNKSKVALELSGTLYADSDEFVKAFNDSVSKQYKAEQSGNTGGSISSGVSSGGGSGKVSSTIGVGSMGGASIELEPFEDDGFKDLADVDWAKPAIEYLQEKAVISGIAPNVFAPQNTVKREEFIKMLVLTLGRYNAGAVCTFADVSNDHWSYSYIASAFENGLVSGIDENKFGLGMEISRQDACVLLYRALSEKTSANAPKEFTDKSEISDYAVEAVDAMSSMGLVNGMDDGSFKPKNVMTRAEAAKLLYELCQVIGG